jgi:catechol 2,3-dioxygenase-like lactoylglutathione lyase family enzyme
MGGFNISFLDHVAIRAKDIKLSAQWYEKVIGLKRMNLPQWKNIPVFMSAGKAAVAIFPANINDPEINKLSRNSKIDHFAFNVSNEDFEKAKEHYKELGQEFKFQDHFYFHSIYTSDPDGHTVELTTLVADEETVYGSISH